MKTEMLPCLIMTKDSSLGYLFSVVLKTDEKVVHDQEEVVHCLDRAKSLELVIVHAESADAQPLSIIRQAKALRPSPVVILIQSAEAAFGAEAFLAGADDVVSWPCCLHELAIRIYMRLGLVPDQDLTGDADITWETEAYIADRAGLTTAEAQVLRVLYTHDGEIVSRDDLSHAVDARPWRYGDRKFDVHVAKIRKKLSDSFGATLTVSTIRSLGYKFSTQEFDFS